jgi:hypothetical protein
MSLPKARETGQSLSDQLEAQTAEYLLALKELDKSSVIGAAVKRKFPAIKKLQKGISEAVDAYLNGSPAKAYSSVTLTLGRVKSDLESLTAPENSIGQVYRIRRFDTLGERTRGEIFHVPFDRRYCISSQRYSISGWPSLYLGGSLLVCWEELGRPPLETVDVSSFQAIKRLSVLDFGYQPRTFFQLHDVDGFFTDGQVVSYLVLWPLLCACSMRPAHRGAAFIEEYIVPQLLLEWIKNESKKIDGVRYFSTRVAQQPLSPRLAINYVFPVKTIHQSGYCSSLKGTFALTKPVSWTILNTLDKRKFVIALNNDPGGMPVGDDLVSYNDTRFKDIEDILGVLKVDKLS